MASPELEAYIKQNLSSGFSKEQIKTQPLANNWPERDIELALTNFSSTSNLQTHPEKLVKNTPRFLIPFGTFILVLLAGVGSYTLISKGNSTSKSTTASSSVTNSSSANMSNWKTDTDDANHLTWKYPDGWTVLVAGSINNPPILSLKNWAADNDAYLNKSIGCDNCRKIYSPNLTKVAGKDAIVEEEDNGLLGQREYVVYIQYNSTTIVTIQIIPTDHTFGQSFSTSTTSQKEALLATFKFTQ